MGVFGRSAKGFGGPTFLSVDFPVSASEDGDS